MSITTIEWTKRPGTIGETWNPTTGCNKVDRGCKHCYAEIMHRRLQAMGQKKYQQDFLAGPVCHDDLLEMPFTWKKPRTIFVDSMSDLFHEKVGYPFLYDVFQVMKDAPEHTFLILTKRPENAVAFWNWRKLRGDLWTCPPNVWLGTSINDQESANKRIPILLTLDGCLRFLSYEPATGPAKLRRLVVKKDALDEDGKSWREVEIDALGGRCLERFFEMGKQVHINTLTLDHPRLHWVIMGGESGPKADPMHPQWVRHIRNECLASGTPFFFKQWGAWAPVNYHTGDFELKVKFALGSNEFLFTDPPQNMKRVGKHAGGHELDGETWQQFPETKIASI